MCAFLGGLRGSWREEWGSVGPGTGVLYGPSVSIWRGFIFLSFVFDPSTVRNSNEGPRGLTSGCPVAAIRLFRLEETHQLTWKLSPVVTASRGHSNRRNSS